MKIPKRKKCSGYVFGNFLIVIEARGDCKQRCALKYANHSRGMYQNRSVNKSNNAQNSNRDRNHCSDQRVDRRKTTNICLKSCGMHRVQRNRASLNQAVAEHCEAGAKRK